jgi:shikimate dehydrogenase
MQNAAIRAAGMDAVYFALRCGTESMPPLIHALARAGGGGNVTIPHKAAAAAAVERPSAAVIATGACNAFWFENGHIHGDNTDVEGFEAAAKSIVGSLHGVHACLLGAGGAARAVIHAILRGGGEVLVLGRRPAALEAIEAAFGNDPRLRTAAGTNPLPPGSLDLLVNATPVGMSGAAAPLIDLDALPRLRAVIDLVTRSGGTALTRAASVRGIAAIDGREMLLAQGAAAFERWFGRRAPVDAMRAAITD